MSATKGGYQGVPSTDEIPDERFTAGNEELRKLYLDGKFKSIDTVRSSISYDDEDEIKELRLQVDPSETIDEKDWYDPVDRGGSRKFGRICILVAVVVGCIWLVGFASFLFADSTKDTRIHHAKAFKSPITFDHVFNGTFGARMARVEWLKEAGDGYFSQREGNNDIWIENVDTGDKKLLVKGVDVKDNNGRQLSYETFQVSADMKYILFSAMHIKQWRHSFFAYYYIWDIEKKHIRAIGSAPTISYAKWSPTGHDLAYVQENDIYVILDLGEPVRVTNDGAANVFNGVPDWVYEEEVFSSNFALWWSPDSKRIAYLRFDETSVPEYKFPIYVNDGYDADSYPDEVVMKYPKAGFDNPIVTTHVYSIEEALRSLPSITTVSYEGEFDDKDRLVTEVAWAGNDHLLVRQTNRISDIMKMVLYDVALNSANVVREVNAADLDGGWFEVSQNLRYLPPSATRKNEGYIDTVIKDGFNHLALFSPLDASEPALYLTSGKWEVVEGVKALDLKNEQIYYLSTEKSSVERHLYKVDLKGENNASLTNVSAPGYHSVSFSPEAGYYLLNYEGPGVPRQAIYKAGNKTFESVLEENKDLEELLRKYSLPDFHHTTINVEGYELNALEIRPPGFDDSGKVKHPVLFRVYGGPGSQLVNMRYGHDWHSLLAAAQNRRYLVVVVDGRGTGFKGRRLRVPVRSRLGYYETIDQVTAAREWAKRRYVDPERIGVWGWSYGGFMAAKCMEADAGVYKFGMSVAPVTDWRFYDSIYTERYMETPVLNEEGYTNSSVRNMEGFKHSEYLLVHGTADDNVHYQNTALLADRLTVNGIEFEMRVFTDSDHSISHHNAQRAIYELLTDFVDRQFAVAKKEIDV